MPASCGEPPTLAESLRPSTASGPQADDRETLALADAFMHSLKGVQRPSLSPQQVAAMRQPEQPGPDQVMPPSPGARRAPARVTPPSPIPLDASAKRRGEPLPVTDAKSRGAAPVGENPVATAPPANLSIAHSPASVVIVQPTEQQGRGERLGLGAPRFGLGQL